MRRTCTLALNRKVQLKTIGGHKSEKTERTHFMRRLTQARRINQADTQAALKVYF